MTQKQISQHLIQLAETLPKVALAVVGLAYVIGVVIRSVHVMAYGLFYLDFLKVEYVLTGILWVVLTGATYIYLYYLIRGIKNHWATSKRSNPVRVLTYRVWTISSLMILGGLVVWCLPQQPNKLSPLLIVVAILILTVATIYVLQSNLRRVIKKRLKNSTDLEAPNASEMLSTVFRCRLLSFVVRKICFPEIITPMGRR